MICIFGLAFSLPGDLHANFFELPLFRKSIAEAIYQGIMWFIICLWVYCAPRFRKGHEDLEKYLHEITGDSKEKDKLWREQSNWIYAKPRYGETTVMRFVKKAYGWLWTIMMAVSIGVPIIQRHIDFLSGYNPLTLQSFITLILAIVSIGLCKYSWWGCMEYGYFLNEVSQMECVMERLPAPNNYPSYRFNNVHPSQTHAIIEFLHGSTMTSIVFLIVSGLYTVQYGAAIFLDNIQIGKSPIETLWLISVLVPGILSLIPVVVCPKVFLLRLHRRWKLQLIKDYEEKIRTIEVDDEEQYRKETEYWSNLINEVEKDRIAVRNYEIIGSVLSILLNVAIVFATLEAG